MFSASYVSSFTLDAADDASVNFPPSEGRSSSNYALPLSQTPPPPSFLSTHMRKRAPVDETHETSGRYLHSATVLNNNVYIIGGQVNARDTADTVVNVNATFDVGKQDTRISVTGHGAIPYKDKVLVLCGAETTSDPLELADTVQLVDPTTGNVEPVPQFKGDPPRQRLRHTVTLVNNRAYVVGGVSFNGKRKQYMNDVSYLDVESDTWTQVKSAELGVPIYGHTTVVVGDYLVSCFGQNDKDKVTNDCSVLDTSTNTFVNTTSIGMRPTPRTGVSMAAGKGDSIIVFGGIDLENRRSYDDVYVLDTSNLPAELSWRKVNVTSVAANDNDGGDGVRDVVPSARGAHSAVSLGNGSLMMVYGGVAYSGRRFETVDDKAYFFDTAESSWVGAETAENIVANDATKKSGGSSPAGLVAAICILVVLSAVIGFFVVRRRRNCRNPKVDREAQLDDRFYRAGQLISGGGPYKFEGEVKQQIWHGRTSSETVLENVKTGMPKMGMPKARYDSQYEQSPHESQYNTQYEPLQRESQYTARFVQYETREFAPNYQMRPHFTFGGSRPQSMAASVVQEPPPATTAPHYDTTIPAPPYYTPHPPKTAVPATVTAPATATATAPDPPAVQQQTPSTPAPPKAAVQERRRSGKTHRRTSSVSLSAIDVATVPGLSARTSSSSRSSSSTALHRPRSSLCNVVYPPPGANEPDGPNQLNQSNQSNQVDEGFSSGGSKRSSASSHSSSKSNVLSQGSKYEDTYRFEHVVIDDNLGQDESGPSKQDYTTYSEYLQDEAGSLERRGYGGDFLDHAEVIATYDGQQRHAEPNRFTPPTEDSSHERDVDQATLATLDVANNALFASDLALQESRLQPIRESDILDTYDVVNSAERITSPPSVRSSRSSSSSRNSSRNSSRSSSSSKRRSSKRGSRVSFATVEERIEYDETESLSSVGLVRTSRSTASSQEEVESEAQITTASHAMAVRPLRLYEEDDRHDFDEDDMDESRVSRFSLSAYASLSADDETEPMPHNAADLAAQAAQRERQYQQQQQQQQQLQQYERNQELAWSGKVASPATVESASQTVSPPKRTSSPRVRASIANVAMDEGVLLAIRGLD